MVRSRDGADGLARIDADCAAQLRIGEQLDARLGASLGTTPLLSALKGITPAVASGDWTKTDEHFTQRVEASTALLNQAADGSSLTLDPDLDTHYLMDATTAGLPMVIESTSRLRDAARSLALGLPASEAVVLGMIRSEALSDFGDERWAAGMPKVYSLPPDFRNSRRGWRRSSPWRCALPRTCSTSSTSSPTAVCARCRSTWKR